MIIHQLKIGVNYLDNLLCGKKTCEIRKNDRDYQVGDYLLFNRVILNSGIGQNTVDFCGRHPRFEITHVLSSFEGLANGYVALSLKNCSPNEAVNPTPHES